MFGDTTPDTAHNWTVGAVYCDYVILSMPILFMMKAEVIPALNITAVVITDMMDSNDIPDSP